MEFYVKVKNDRIEDIKFKTFGCGSAIATASMITELARGKTLEEALRITRQDVAEELDGLPPIKMHCSNLAADALKDAIKKYQERQKPQPEQEGVQKDRKEIAGIEKFMNKGLYRQITDLAAFTDRRTMVLDTGERSMKTAHELTRYTPRVIFTTKNKQLPSGASGDMLKSSAVKILYESEILEIKGLNTVEKVVVHDLNEDEEYELFVDSIIILS